MSTDERSKRADIVRRLAAVADRQ